MQDRDSPQLKDRYALGATLGEGGMGRVFEAWDELTHRRVAIKQLRGPWDEELKTQFLAEAKLTGQLEHPNIIPVYDAGIDEAGAPFLVMRLVEGPTLQDVILRWQRGREAPWPVNRRVSVISQVANAIAYAHAHGVLHRDLKPENVMLGAHGEVLVLDWGLARFPDAGRAAIKGAGTLTGGFIGTPGYAAPEQCFGSSASEASDVWGLGVLLLEVISLKPAFTGSAAEKVNASVSRMPPLDGVPEALAALIERCLQRETDERLASGAEFAGELRSFVDGDARRRRALQHVDEARKLDLEIAAVREAGVEAGMQVKALRTQTPTWATVEEKAALWDSRSRQRQLRLDEASLFGRLVRTCERALAEDSSPEAREILAEVYWERFVRSEREGRDEDQAFYREQVLTFGGASMTERLSGKGTLSVVTDPPCDVVSRRVDDTRIVWELEPEVCLGSTPLEVEIDVGSYVLTLRARGHAEVTYPIVIRRDECWSPEQAVELPIAASPDDWCHVPAGPFQSGGDHRAAFAGPRAEVPLPAFDIARFPVTCGEYCDFLNEVHARDPDAAWARVPRLVTNESGGHGQFWERAADDGQYSVPERDPDGDRWDPRWPIFGVTWHDAIAYAEWRSGWDLGARLATELEWEKAARGVDGRQLPWGRWFDPSLCHMRASQQGRPLPRPVGSYETDVSVYGVRDLAGGVREWTGDLDMDGDRGRRPIRGGSWSGFERACRAANRFGLEPHMAYTYLGFRMARSGAHRSVKMTWTKCKHLANPIGTKAKENLHFGLERSKGQARIAIRAIPHKKGEARIVTLSVSDSGPHAVLRLEDAGSTAGVHTLIGPWVKVSGAALFHVELAVMVKGSPVSKVVAVTQQQDEDTVLSYSTLKAVCSYV